MSTANLFSSISPWICLLIPTLYGLGAVLPIALGQARVERAFRAAERLAGGAFALAALAFAFSWQARPVADPLAELLGGAADGSRVLSVRAEPLSACMLLLVSFVGFIVLRYSRRYLQGDPQQAPYLRRLLLTLAAVAALVSVNNLLFIACLWLCTSLSLHGLLTHFSARMPAQVAAHKKFLLSRLADLCLLAAVALLGDSLQTLELDRMFAAVSALQTLPAPVALAALLIAVSALLKCAQLPFHGWLIQVMEAPTPVSALLHAGIVNISGFLLIRLAPLMGRAEAAQNLLLGVGLSTAAVASLVMLTRISIKVMLAWSTCAQMGLMLVECALGAYDVALLHLLAHSLYKAHAFLGAGGVLTSFRVAAMSPRPRRIGFAATVLAGAGCALLLALLFSLSGASVTANPRLWFPGLLLALALPELLVTQPQAGRASLLPSLTRWGVGAAAAYGAGHWLFGALLPHGSLPADSGAGRAALACAGLALLFLLHAWIRQRPDSALARWLYLRAFNGFYLDELFTRLTFRIWPAKLPTVAAAPLGLPQPTESLPQ